MDHKKKYLGGLKLFLLVLFMLLLGTFSTCYASLTKSYIDYTFDYLYNSKDNVGISLNSTQNDVFDNFRNSDTLKNQFISQVDYYLNQRNLINLTDVNCFIYMIKADTIPATSVNFACVFSNAGAPQGYNDLGFVEFLPYQAQNKIRFQCRGSSTDYIYVFLIRVRSNIVERQYSYNLNPGAYFGFSNFPNLNLDYININNDNSVLTINNYLSCAYLPAVYSVSPFVENSTFYPMILKDGNGNYGNVAPEPEQPSGDSGGGGTITPSGDSNSGDGGSTSTPDYTNQLNNINSSVNNVNTSVQDVKNQISGDTKKITNSIDNINSTLTESANMDNINISSGDILNNFDFMSDPYSNFWWDFIDGVELALLGSVRQMPVNWLGYNGFFNLDGLINYPTPLKNILTTVSTVCVVWIMLKWWKVIMDKLTSGDIDEVLEIIEEQGRVNITNLF